MALAKAKGRLRGKQPKLSTRQEAHLVRLYRAGEHTVNELEELFAITRSTGYRAVARAGGRTTQPTGTGLTVTGLSAAELAAAPGVGPGAQDLRP